MFGQKSFIVNFAVVSSYVASETGQCNKIDVSKQALRIYILILTKSGQRRNSDC